MIRSIWKKEQLKGLVKDVIRGLHLDDICDRYDKTKSEILEKIGELYSKGILDFKFGSLERARSFGICERNMNSERKKFGDILDGVCISENKWDDEEEEDDGWVDSVDRGGILDWTKTIDWQGFKGRLDGSGPYLPKLKFGSMGTGLNDVVSIVEGHCINCRIELEECQGCNTNLICKQCEVDDIYGILCDDCRQSGICVNCREETNALYSCRAGIREGIEIGNCGIECLCNDCSRRNRICRTCDINLCQCGTPHGGKTWQYYCTCGIKTYCLNCEPTDNVCNECNEVTDWRCSTQYSSICRHGENCNWRDLNN